MQTKIYIKKAIEETFDYLIKTTLPAERQKLKLKLQTAIPRSIVQVIDPLTFHSINDLNNVYVCDTTCNLFFTDTQFRRAWAITTGKKPSKLRFIQEGKTIYLTN